MISHVQNIRERETGKENSSPRELSGFPLKLTERLLLPLQEVISLSWCKHI